MFFLSFHICFTLPFGLEISLERQQTIAFILRETDSLPEICKPTRTHRAVGLPWSLVLRTETVCGWVNVSQILAKRHRFNCPPSSPWSDINTASLVKEFLFNILIKKWPAVDSPNKYLFSISLCKKKKKRLLFFKPQRQGAWVFYCFR